MIVDGGGRGQALAAKLSPECGELFVSPGNPGNETFAHSTGITTTDIEAQLRFAQSNNIELTIVGNDDPLALGIVDNFQENGLAIFGPTREQARIEWDKNFAKRLARTLEVPIGAYAFFDNLDSAVQYSKNRTWPLYAKDNGLAQGKGVTRCADIEELTQAVQGLKNIIIEDYVIGPEASHHAFCDGKTQLSIPFLVRDHKQVGEDDTGPMTGGMGTVGPLPNYTPQEVIELGKIFVRPIVQKLGFKGMLFSGLKGVKGSERSLEWNARPGDPETQVFMQLMRSNLLPVIMACIDGTLDKLPPIEWHKDLSVICLALCAEGYPVNPQKGAVIEGIEGLAEIEGLQILQAGTQKNKNGRLVVSGGRVLNIVAQAKTLKEAIDKAYKASENIAFGDKPPIIRSGIGRTAIL